MKTMKLIAIFTFALALPLAGQTPNFNRSVCNGPWASGAIGRIAMFIPVQVPVGGLNITVTIPICAELGTNLQLSNSGGTWTINGPQPSPPVQVPKMYVEKFIIPANPPFGTDFTITLAKEPAPNTVLMVYLQSSRLGMDHFDSIVPQGQNKKIINVTLSLLRPFTADDKFTVTYWSLE